MQNKQHRDDFSKAMELYNRSIERHSKTVKDYDKKIQSGDKVKTMHGRGVVVKAEGMLGVLSHRFLVKLEKVPLDLQSLHNGCGGLYYDISELL